MRPGVALTVSLLLQASWTWGPEGQGAILLVNCDRDTPWLPKEDCSDEKVYSKQGASGPHWGTVGAWCSVRGRTEGEAGVYLGLQGIMLKINDCKDSSTAPG